MQLQEAMRKERVDGIYKYLPKYPVLSLEEEKELTQKYFESQDPTIREKLVNHNLRLVVKISHEYGYSEDLISEGCFGLVKGIENFDPRKGVKLSTYIAYWIRAYILNYIYKNSSTVRMSTTESNRKAFYALAKTKAKLNALGVDFDAAVLANSIGVKEETIHYAERHNALDIRIDESTYGNDLSKLDMVVCEQTTPHDLFSVIESNANLSKKFNEFKSKLKPIEQTIFEHRMVGDLTLQEVGDMVGLTRERIRQIENKLTEKLKNYCTQHKIKIEDAA